MEYTNREERLSELLLRLRICLDALEDTNWKLNHAYTSNPFLGWLYHKVYERGICQQFLSPILIRLAQH